MGAQADEGKTAERSQTPPTGDTTAQEDGGIEIDEEAFNAWQSANAEADSSASQRQSKGCQTCTSGCIEILFLVMIVAKLEQAYVYEKDGEGDGGFDTLWLLSPLFFLVGSMVL